MIANTLTELRNTLAQDENNYAELGTFKSPNNNDKPKDKPKTEYATLEELGELKDYEEPNKPKEEDPQTHKITVEPESSEETAADKGTGGNAPDASAPDASVPSADVSTTAPVEDTSTSAQAADTSSSAPAADASIDGGFSGSVDMI